MYKYGLSVNPMIENQLFIKDLDNNCIEKLNVSPLEYKEIKQIYEDIIRFEKMKNEQEENLYGVLSNLIDKYRVNQKSENTI